MKLPCHIATVFLIINYTFLAKYRDLKYLCMLRVRWDLIFFFYAAGWTYTNANGRCFQDKLDNCFLLDASVASCHFFKFIVHSLSCPRDLSTPMVKIVTLSMVWNFTQVSLKHEMWQIRPFSPTNMGFFSIASLFIEAVHLCDCCCISAFCLIKIAELSVFLCMY